MDDTILMEVYILYIQKVLKHMCIAFGKYNGDGYIIICLECYHGISVLLGILISLLIQQRDFKHEVGYFSLVVSNGYTMT